MATDFQDPAPDLTLSDFPFVAALADSADPDDRRIWLRVACDHFALAGRADPEAIERFQRAVAAEGFRCPRPPAMQPRRKAAV